MLIVLSIIGLMVAVLLPAFNGVREGARIATCSSNLKQIYQGTRLYLQDNNGTLPGGYVNNPAPMRGYCGWANRIYPYVRSTTVFQCPKAEHGEFRLECPPDSEDGQDQWDGSYNYNHLRIGNRQRIKETSIGNPTTVCLYIDGPGGDILTPYAVPFDKLSEGYAEAADGPRGHRGSLNVCFADGHVKPVRSNAMSDRALWFNTLDEVMNAPVATPTP
jgi:prepilin-type processing-associated H-X9-DG protein